MLRHIPCPTCGAERLHVKHHRSFESRVFLDDDGNIVLEEVEAVWSKPYLYCPNGPCRTGWPVELLVAASKGEFHGFTDR